MPNMCALPCSVIFIIIIQGRYYYVYYFIAYYCILVSPLDLKIILWILIFPELAQYQEQDKFSVMVDLWHSPLKSASFLFPGDVAFFSQPFSACSMPHGTSFGSSPSSVVLCQSSCSSPAKPPPGAHSLVDYKLCEQEGVTAVRKLCLCHPSFSFKCALHLCFCTTLSSALKIPSSFRCQHQMFPSSITSDHAASTLSMLMSQH